MKKPVKILNEQEFIDKTLELIPGTKVIIKNGKRCLKFPPLDECRRVFEKKVFGDPSYLFKHSG